jgi:predicted nucleotidyltransferase
LRIDFGGIVFRPEGAQGFSGAAEQMSTGRPRASRTFGLEENRESLAHEAVFSHCLSVVKRSKILAYSEAIARKFRPRKIVLFGSYAYGRPTEDSDVDLLVILPRTRDRGERMSVRILHAIPRDFPLDLLVRTPADVAKRLRWKDPFICDVVENGEVLYEADDA